MADPVWNGTEWVNSGIPDNTVTPAEAPTNDNGTLEPSNYLICDRTGFRIPVAEGLREEWDHRMVRKASYEPRHPQDFVRSVPDERRGSKRPEQEDQFIEDEYPNGVVY